MGIRHAMVLAVAAGALAGCVDRGPGAQAKHIDPAYIEAHLLSAPPTELTSKVDADLGGKVVYLGNVAPAGPIAPGQKVTIKHYWKVVTPPGGEWKVFSHLRGEGSDFQNIDQTDMRIGHGPSTWQAGEIIEDIQDFALKAEWRSPTATLIVGLYPKGKHRVEDRLAVVSGPSLDRAVIAVKLDVDVSKAPPPPGSVVIKKASAPITLDGKADEPGWAAAAQSPEFPTAEGSPEPPGKTTARMTWDDKALYVFVQVTDPDVWSEYKNPDDPLWKADTVEVFVDADGNKRGYVELQVNPNNAHFDSWFAGTRSQPGDPGWTSGMESAVAVRGTADNRDDRDEGWDVELAIPWAAIKGRDDAMAVRIPPQPGDRWRLNVVRVDKAKGDKNPSASSWSKITYQDFHGLDRLLNVVFADEAGGTTAPAAAAVVAPNPGPEVGPAVAPGGGAGSAAPAKAPAVMPGAAAPAKAQGAAPAKAQGAASVKAEGAAPGAEAATLPARTVAPVEPAQRPPATRTKTGAPAPIVRTPTSPGPRAPKPEAPVQ